MDIVHVFVKLQDTFSFAYKSVVVTKTEADYRKMQAAIGTTFTRFDKRAQVSSNYEVLEVRQATQDEYKAPF